MERISSEVKKIVTRLSVSEFVHKRCYFRLSVLVYTVEGRYIRKFCGFGRRAIKGSPVDREIGKGVVFRLSCVFRM